MHEIESPAFDFGAAKRRAQPSLASVFEQFHERWLSASERFDPSPKNLARIASLRAAEYRAEALCAANSASVIELVCAQFATEPLTLVVGFSNEVLRATIEDIVATCIAVDAVPNVVITSHGVAVAVGVSVPFAAETAISPEMPPEVARLFGAMNQINAHVVGARERLGDPLIQGFEWLIAAVAPGHRIRLPVDDASRPASLFQALTLSTFELARQRGFRTAMAHTNDQSARPLYDLGLVSEMVLPYSELRDKARSDIPGSLNFTSCDLARVLAPFAID